MLNRIKLRRMDWAIGKRGSIDPSTWRYYASMVELVYTGGLKPPAFGIVGSSPTTCTKFKISKAYCLQTLEIVYIIILSNQNTHSVLNGINGEKPWFSWSKP